MNATAFHKLALSFGLTIVIEAGEFIVSGTPHAIIEFLEAALNGGATYLGNVSTFAPGGPATSSTRRFALA